MSAIQGNITYFYLKNYKPQDDLNNVLIRQISPSMKIWIGQLQILKKSLQKYFSCRNANDKKHCNRKFQKTIKNY